MIALVDYGAGNLTSVRKALSALGAEFMTPQQPRDLQGAVAIIVPGVGHFAATNALDDEWRDTIGDSRMLIDTSRPSWCIDLGVAIGCHVGATLNCAGYYGASLPSKPRAGTCPPSARVTVVML